VSTQQNDLQELLSTAAAERLALIQRHEAGARVVSHYDFNNTYQYVISREETHQLQTDSSVIVAVEPPQTGRPTQRRSAGSC